MAIAAIAPASDDAAAPLRRWTDTAGAWLGVGSGTGALLMGAGLTASHGGSIPLTSILLGLLLLSSVVWLQGQLGLRAPAGEGVRLFRLADRYFTPGMQRTLGALIGIGMTGWVGVNIGMGAAALAALLSLPQWVTALLLGVPVTAFSWRGIRSWNPLAAATTACVLVLVVMVALRASAGGLGTAAGPWAPAPSAGDPRRLLADMAVMLGYVGVFSVRCPDFTAGLDGRRDLTIVVLLLAGPLLVVTLAGGLLAQAGSADLFRVLAGSGSLAIGNLLIAAAVIAPTFTTYYSGAPALRAATGISERAALLLMAVFGLALAVAHFDQYLLRWLSILGAMLPPVVVPLIAEFMLRRRGHAARLIPPWPWLVGASAAFTLALLKHPLAMVTGFAVTGLATAIWRRRSHGRIVE